MSNIHPGFVWYNYLDCPSCKCIAADKEKLKLAAKKREIQQKREVAMGKVPLEELPKVENPDEKEEPPTIAEWLDDNSRVLFGVIVSLVAVIIFVSIIIFTQLSNKSTATAAATATATSTDKSSTPVTTENVTKDSVKSSEDETKENSTEKPTKTDKNEKDD